MWWLFRAALYVQFEASKSMLVISVYSRLFFLSPGDPRQTVTLKTNKSASAPCWSFSKALGETGPTFYLGRQQLQRLWIGQPTTPLFTNGAECQPSSLCSFSLDCLLPVCLKGGTLWRWTVRENISARPSADQWRCVYLPMGTMVTPYNGYLTACWPIASRRSLKLVDQWWDTLQMWGHAMYLQRLNGPLCPALVQT